jgi:transposase
MIGKLFDTERGLVGVPPEIRLSARLRDSKPVLTAFENWCDEESLRAIDESPISKAIGYARNQRGPLRAFLADGRIPIHNNWSERELRREAVGRKNWLFLGSDEGGEANATFVSLLASCQLHEVEPFSYLRDLLCLLPGWSQLKLLELSPMKWKETVAKPEVQAELERNIFRRASLGQP